ncbi:MAG: AMP-binding protein [Candidatus Eisenbacteria bacterium]|nr:AMP-binding protein [Candidatus Eisenbacteria bacterium]
METLRELVAGLERRGDAQAVVAFGGDEVRTFTYAELGRAAARVAAGLATRGLGRGDRVAVSSEPSFEAIVSVLGVIGSGASIVPVDVQLTGSPLVRGLEAAGVGLVFTTAERASTLREAVSSLELVVLDEDPGLDGIVGADAEPVKAEPSDEAALFFTSGTTGTVKGVPLTHANITHQIDTLVASELVGPDDRMLLPLPLHHVYPFVVSVLLPLALGMPILLPNSLTGPDLVRALRDGEVTVVIGVPRLYEALLDGIEARVSSRGMLATAWFRGAFGLSYATRRALGLRMGKTLLGPIHAEFGRGLDVVASGGAPLRPEIAWRLEAMGWRVAIGYGLTETSPILTLNPPGRARIGSVGRAIDRVELELDEEAEGAGNGLGEVLARGPNVFAGYLDDEEETDSSFTSDGWFRTGDLGRFDGEGYLFLSGRVSNLIVTEGGENVWPEEVEDAYAASDAVSELGVFERDGRLFGVVVPALAGIAEDETPEEAVRRAVDRVSRELPSYKRINEYAVTRRSLERTRLGKLRRHLLPGRYDEAASGEETAAGPLPLEEMGDDDRRLLENEAAREVWDWFAESYRDVPITPDTSPRHDLGIDSLEWLSLTMELSQRAGVVIGEDTISRVETIRDLLETVQERAEGEIGEEGRDPFEEPEELLNEAQLASLERHDRFEAAMARGLVGFVRGVSRLVYRLEVEGLENLPDEPPYLITPNHVSFLDPFVLGAAMGADRLRDVYWSAWVQAGFSNPVKRYVSRLAKTVPIDPYRAAVSSLALGAAVLGRGHALVWFPEGGRSRAGRLKEFKRGIGMLLDTHPVPVVPVIIRGTYEAWPPGQTLPGAHPVRVTFGKIVRPEELESEGEGDAARDRITSGLRRRMRSMLGEAESEAP